MNNIYLVGQYKFPENECPIQEVQGLFLTKQRALVACRNPQHFIAKFTIDEELTQESCDVSESYYPYEAGDYLYYEGDK